MAAFREASARESLVIANALVAASSSFSLVVILSLLFKLDPSGKTSSFASSLSFFGAVAGGVFGTLLLRNINAKKTGMLLALTGLSAVLLILGVDSHRLLPLFLAIAVLHLVQVVDVACTMQHIEHSVADSDKIRIHSRHQLSLTLASLLAPLLGGIAAEMLGFDALFVVVACFVFSLLSWNYQRQRPAAAARAPRGESFGFRDLYANYALKRLTQFRVLTSCAHSASFVALPYLAVRCADTPALAGRAQAWFLMFAACGFTCAHIALNRKLAKAQPSFVIVLIGCMGTAAAWVSIALTSSFVVGAIACAINGVALYCLRMAGVMIGRAVTAPGVFGQAVLAGDTIARLASAGLGLVVSMIIFRPTGEPNLILIGVLACLAISSIAIASGLWRVTEFQTVRSQ